jgi:hypothetical protein
MLPIANRVWNCSGAGVGLPIVSVRMPSWLWKYATVRNPPFHHVG